MVTRYTCNAETNLAYSPDNQPQPQQAPQGARQATAVPFTNTRAAPGSPSLFNTSLTLGASPAAQAAQQQAIEQEQSASIRVHQGVHRFTAGDAEASTAGVSRHVVSFGGTAGGSIASTLQTVNGMQTVEMVPGQPGTRTQVQSAMRDGLIQKGVGGRWEDVGTAQPTGAQPAAEAQVAEPVPALSPEDAAIFAPALEAQWNQDIEHIPQAAYDHAVAASIGVLVHGGSVDNAARTLAEASGMEPAEAEAYLDAGYSFYGNQVIAALAPMGLTGDRMDAFVSTMQKDQNGYHEALQKLVYMKDMSGFRAAAERFNRHNPV